ncbi:MAG: FixH family protein [Bacteroidota bacterium]
MRFHWGHGIFSFIVLFFILTGIFLVWSQRQDFSLVEDNYYAKELKYQDVITQKTNTENLKEKISFRQNTSGVWVHFPALIKNKTISGNIHVYRPSDSKLDFSILVTPDTAQNLLIPAAKFAKGRYVIKLAWTLDKTVYYQEENIQIP